MTDEPIPVDDWPKNYSPEEMLAMRRDFFKSAFEWSKKSVPADIRMWITFERHESVVEGYIFDREYSTDKPRYIVGIQVPDLGRLATLLLHEGLSFRGLSEEQVDEYVDGIFIPDKE